MATTTTRGERGDRPRTMHAFLAAIVVSAVGFLAIPGADAQVKAPSKSHLKASSRSSANKPSPTDNQAEQLNEKWLNEFNKEKAESADKPAGAVPAAAV